MAKLPALVDALAATDYRSRATIDQIARVVREAGYIPTTKRGSGASDMTAREAANLLIGSFVESPSQAARAVGLYRRLENQYLGVGANDGGLFGALSEARTFGEAIELLIAGVPELLQSFSQYIDDAYGGNHDEIALRALKKGMLRGDFAGIEIEVSRPVPYAEIRIVASPAGNRQVQRLWRFLVTVEMIEAGEINSLTKSDRKIRETVGLPTLMTLFKSLLDEGAE